MNSILRKGSKGADVVQLQQLLRASGYYRGDIDGDFGPGTASAVLSFQQAKGLGADGVVGVRTWQALSASGNFTSTATSSINSPLLVIGSSGQAVSEAQQLLKSKGYYSGRVDRDFGKQTQEAVIAFQTANSLTVDGKVGAATWKLLRAPANDPATSFPTVVEIERQPDPAAKNPNTSSTGSIASAWVAGTIYPPNAGAIAPPPAIPSTPLIPEVITPPVQVLPATPERVMPLTPEAFSSTPPVAIAPSGKVSLVDAAAAFNKTRLVYQTEAVKHLDSQIGYTTRQEFINRWNSQPNSGSNGVLLTTSLEDAFVNYNGNDFPSQPAALIWLENQLAPAALDRFSREWQNVQSSSLTRVSFVEAANQYDRLKFPNQLNAIAYLDQELVNTPDIKAKFAQRWAVATGGGTNVAIAPNSISLVEAFNSYNPTRFPSQSLALDWLQRQLQPAILAEFSRQWQSVISV
jgi:peptidoglycan hydrolase-like protein with peptidoglycan-binding domain